MDCHAKRLECVQLAGAVIRRGVVRKAGASSTHSKRFAQSGCGSASLRSLWLKRLCLGLLLHIDDADLVRELAGARQPAHKSDLLAIGREHARLRARSRHVVHARGEAFGVSGSNFGYTNAVIHYVRNLPAIWTPGECGSYRPRIAGHLPQWPAGGGDRPELREPAMVFHRE